jgi:hypothetical protein
MEALKDINMNSDSILGGVSPFKKKGKSYKGGTADKRAATVGKTFAGTKMHARHGGFGKSTVSSNKAGYNIATRFRVPDKMKFPSSPGSDKKGDVPSAPAKPYTFGPDGSIQFNPVINIGGHTINNNPNFVNKPKNANINRGGTGGSDSEWGSYTTPGHWKKKKIETGGLESYKSTWNRNKDGVKDKYPDFNDYVKAAEDWWAKQGKDAKSKYSRGTHYEYEYVPGETHSYERHRKRNGSKSNGDQYIDQSG